MSKRPNATAGPSSSGNAAGKGRIVKTISRTTDLLKQNEGSSRNGKGKEKEILGDMQPAMADAKSLPGVVSVEKFAKVRAMEILAFQNAIKSAELQGNTRVFQSLPRHLRRRAASHNPRRVPARLRSRAAAEIDPGDNIAKKHRKKAKLRAKGNLRGESRTEQLLKRQRNKTWLRTHMYHAKRFHMVNIWGHRLPLTPTLKSFRPAYRASRRKVLAHDASYFGVIEIEGAKSGITALFSRMLGGPFAGSKYDAGSRAVYTELYHANAFPMGLIGPVTLLWHPSGEKAWLRAHPSIYKESFDAIKRAMGELDHVSDMQIHDLREELSSFELVGPEGGRLLKRVFKVCRDEPSRKSFALLGDPSAISEGTVMGFKVYDPRLSFPPKVLRDDSSDGTPSEDGVVRLNAVLPSEELARSALWDADTREQVLRPSVKKSSLDSRRHSLSLPGTRLRPTSKDDRISIIVIASANTYTLLFPRGWSNAILQSIVYTGTLLGGLEERRAQHRESGRPCFPEHYGNVCKAGREYEAAIAQEDQNHWLRRPPGKRDEEPKTWTPAWQDVFGTANASDMSPWLFPPRLMAYADKAEKAINAFRQARKMDPLPEGFSRNALVQVVVRVEDRGSPGLMAEVYALPAKERRNWVEALTSDNQFGRAHDQYSELQRLGEQQPDPAALVGYATTGNFSMARGRGHALATVTLTAWNELTTLAREAGDEGRLLVKVRNRSGRISRLASLRAV